MDLERTGARTEEGNSYYDDETEDATLVSSYPFNFPFEPYDIQIKLMKVAYDTFEQSKYALLESPTGTGKSMSIICSSLTWLRDHQSKVKLEYETRKVTLLKQVDELGAQEEATGDWLGAQTKRQDLNHELADVNRELDRILKFELRNKSRRHAKLHNVPWETYLMLAATGGEDTKSGNQGELDTSDSRDTSRILGSQESQALDGEEDLEKTLRETPEEDQLRPKIFYASRTHSQLSQFINEIKRTEFANMNAITPVKVVPLASRANLCVNPEVLKLKDSGAINERCTEMQRESSADKRCPYMKLKLVTMLKEDILSSVQDIEDIVSRGRTMGACPYYATRVAIPESEVVVLPYNNLLHHETRKASSLDLRESIVIVDESHNILETICSIHSAPITGQQLIGSHTILSRYYQRFHSRMTPNNAAVIKVIVQFLTALIRFLDEPRKHLKDYEGPVCDETDSEPDLERSVTKKEITNGKKGEKAPAIHEEFMVDVKKFTGAANVEQFNVFKIVDYFRRSQLARKLLGLFRQDNTIDLSIDLFNLETDEKGKNLKQKGKQNGGKPPPKRRKVSISKQPLSETEQTSAPKLDSTSLEFLKKTNEDFKKQGAQLTSYPVYHLVEFLRSLTNLAHDGKVLTHHFENNIQNSILKFILLNPSSQFTQMAQEARSIVLAGGTMQPFEEFIDLLFGPLGIEKDRLTLFSCGHVIGADRLYLATLSNGSTGKPLELSYKTRSSFETIDEIGRTIMTISSAVPDGMVCFLPSYDYEQLCFNRWTKIGVIANIETRSKQVFREPRLSSQLKPILEEYSRVVEKNKGTGRGALLLSVVGGKMSEGINFNDNLGRCVVMVGLPFANIRSGELQQKMAYYDRTCKEELAPNQPSAGQRYYENLCIKGINQSIGRAIRHRKDYAAIILLDRRYSSRNSIRSGLPLWMGKSMEDHDRFGPMYAKLRSFFNRLSAE